MQTNMLIDEEQQLAALKGNGKKDGVAIEQESILSPEEQLEVAKQRVEQLKKETEESKK